MLLTVLLAVITFVMGVVFSPSLLSLGKTCLESNSMSKMFLMKAKSKVKHSSWNLEYHDREYLNDCMKDNKEFDIAYICIPDEDKYLYSTRSSGFNQVEAANRKFWGSMWKQASPEEKHELLKYYFDMIQSLADNYISSKTVTSETIESLTKEHSRKTNAMIDAQKTSSENLTIAQHWEKDFHTQI